LFNPQKEKETFLEAIREFVTMDPGASTCTVLGSSNQSYDGRLVYGMPLIFDSCVPTIEKVSPLKRKSTNHFDFVAR